MERKYRHNRFYYQQGTVWPSQSLSTHERARKPIEEKESYRGLESYQLACEVQQRCPTTLVVNVADRAGDLQECFLEAMSRAAADRAEFIIRAKCNRRLAPGHDQSYLGPQMPSTPPLGHLTIQLARRGEHAPRQATLTVAPAELASRALVTAAAGSRRWK